MNESNQKADTLFISVYDSVFVSDEVIIEAIIVMIATASGLSFNSTEIARLREVLRISLGDYAGRLTEEDLGEFGASMLSATAIVLKAKYSQERITTQKVLTE